MPAKRKAISEKHVVLGRLISEYRARRGLTQENLGFHSGLHRNYVGAIERGEINPTFTTLLRLERGLNAPLSELLDTFEQRLEEGKRP